jgi:hypothetical protein
MMEIRRLREVSDMLFHLAALLHDFPERFDYFSEKVEAMEQQELFHLLQDREIVMKALCVLIGDQCQSLHGDVDHVIVNLSEREEDEA